MTGSLATAAPSASGSILSTLVALAVVVALILAMAWILRRLQGGGVGNGGAIRVVASTSLGMKERLVLVEVAGEQMLLGVTAARIELLQRLDSPVEIAKPSVPFMQLLARHSGMGKVAP